MLVRQLILLKINVSGLGFFLGLTTFDLNHGLIVLPDIYSAICLKFSQRYLKDDSRQLAYCTIEIIIIFTGARSYFSSM